MKENMQALTGAIVALCALGVVVTGIGSLFVWYIEGGLGRETVSYVLLGGLLAAGIVAGVAMNNQAHKAASANSTEQVQAIASMMAELANANSGANKSIARQDEQVLRLVASAYNQGRSTRVADSGHQIEMEQPAAGAPWQLPTNANTFVAGANAGEEY